MAARIAAHLAGRRGPFLPYGATAAPPGIAAPLVGCDPNPRMIARQWPGNGPGRRAVVADRMRLPVAAILAAAEAALGPVAAFARAQGLAGAEHFESYRGASAVCRFPTRAAFAAEAAAAGLACRFEPTAGYPGAADCPIALLTRT